MRGLEIAPEVMMMVVLALIIGGIIIGTAATQGAGLNSAWSFFKGLFNFTTAANTDTITAESSVSGLTCAINSVISGTALPCASVKQAGFTGLVPLVSAQQQKTSIYCNAAASECTVENFNLPQKVGKAQEWIDGYDDPNFIMYWQSFPQGEDKPWSSMSTWIQGVGTVVLWAVPASMALKIFGKGKKAGVVLEDMPAYKRYFQRFTDWIAGKLKLGAGKIVNFVYDNTLGRAARIEAIRTFVRNRMNRQVVEELGSDWFKYWSAIDKDKVVVVGTEGMLEKEFRAVARGEESSVDLIEYIKLSSDKTSILGKLGFKNMDWDVIKSYAQKAGFVSVTAYIAARLDSQNEKYVDKFGKMVLKSPFKDAEEFDLAKLSIEPTPAMPYGGGMPVVLDKPGVVTYGGDTTAYLASPCRADVKVTKGTAICDGYSYDKATGATKCSVVAANANGDYMACGSVEQVNYGENDRNVFLDQDGDGKTDRILLSATLLVNSRTDTGKVTLEDTDRDGLIDEVSWYDSKANVDPFVSTKKGSVKHVQEQYNDTDSGLTVYYFEYTDKDGDGRYDIQYRDFSGQIAKGFIDADPDGPDGVYETGIGTNYDVTRSIKYTTETGATVQVIGDVSLIPPYDAQSSNSEPGSPSASSQTIGPFFVYDYESDGKWDRISYRTLFAEDLDSDGMMDVAYNTLSSADYYCHNGNCDDAWTRGSKTSVETHGRCITPAIVITADKSKYSSEEHNYCYATKREAVGTAIVVGSLVADGIMEYYSAGLLYQVAVGFTTGVVAYVNTLYEEWPG
jgi:hypothetical protein